VKGSTADRLNVRQCCRFLGALAEPERLRIVECLLAGPRTVGEVGQAVASPMANVSHHLRQLRAAGLLEATKRGRFVVYSLAPGVVREMGTGRRDVLDFGCCQLDLGKR
jgi:ArsR family transcriptional regulator